MVNDLYNWFMENKTELLHIWTALVTIASIIVRLTPTLPKKAKALPLVKFLGKYIALNKTVVDSKRPKSK